MDCPRGGGGWTNLKRWEVTVISSGQTGLAPLQTRLHTHTDTRTIAQTQVIKVLGDRVSLLWRHTVEPTPADSLWSDLSSQFYVFHLKCLVFRPSWPAPWVTAWLKVCPPASLTGWLTDRLADLCPSLFFCVQSLHFPRLSGWLSSSTSRTERMNV